MARCTDALKLLPVLLVLAFVAACSTSSKQVEVKRTQLVMGIFHPGKPNPIVAPSIDSRNFFKVLEDENGQPMMCMGPQDHLTLGSYLADVRRYVKESNNLLDYYREAEQRYKAVIEAPPP